MHNVSAWRGVVMLGLALACVGQQARADIVFDQSSVAPNTAGSLAISDYVTAEDFVVSSAVTLTGLQVWLFDARATSDNGILDNFGGTLSWGIFADSAGSPGTLLATGADATPVLTDTGFNGTGGTFAGDVVRAGLVLSGPSLAAGTYWLGLHEGTWGSAYDLSSIFWYATTTGFGSTARTNIDEVTLGAPWTDPGFPEFITAFRLSGVVVQVVPEPPTAPLLLLSLCALGLALVRRRAMSQREAPIH